MRYLTKLQISFLFLLIITICKLVALSILPVKRCFHQFSSNVIKFPMLMDGF